MEPWTERKTLARQPVDGAAGCGEAAIAQTDDGKGPVPIGSLHAEVEAAAICHEKARSLTAKDWE